MGYEEIKGFLQEKLVKRLAAQKDQTRCESTFFDIVAPCGPRGLIMCEERRLMWKENILRA